MGVKKLSSYGLKMQWCLRLVLILFILLPEDTVFCYSGDNVTIKSNSDTVNSTLKKAVFEGVRLQTCCPIDLNSRESVECKKLSPEDEVIPSESLNIPSHLMAENITTTFPLMIQKAPCLPGDMDKVYLGWSSQPSRATLFLKNGYLKVEQHFYHMDEYCINGKNATNLEVYVCRQDCMGPRPCIKKCCGLDKVYSFGFSIDSKTGIAPLKGCQNPGTEYFSPILYSDFLNPASTSGALAPHYIENYPKSFKHLCHDNRTTFFIHPNTSKVISEHVGLHIAGIQFRLRSDGKILYKGLDGACAVIDPHEENICYDGIINYDRESHPFKNNIEETVIFLCALPEPEGHKEYGGFLYGGLMCGSSVFLLLTIIVYILLWERQNVHGWTILSHVVSLFFMYIFLGTAHLLRVTKGHAGLNTSSCFAIGVLSHFFFLSTFCWLSIISLDLWLTFRAITPRRGNRSKGLGRYIKYSILGWGVPITIVTVGWVLNAKHPENECGTMLTPAYGVYSCFLQVKAFGAYLYYPIAIMMGVNFFLFTVTSVKIYRYRNSTKMATKDDNQEQFYRLFFKLFFVMGVLYIFELISWAVSGTGVFVYWVFFDILNILRAVAVFIIFVCKPDIIWALEQNYPWLKPVLIPFACITRNKRSFSQRNAETESVGLSSSTKQSTIRRTTTIN